MDPIFEKKQQQKQNKTKKTTTKNKRLTCSHSGILHGNGTDELRINTTCLLVIFNLRARHSWDMIRYGTARYATLSSGIPQVTCILSLCNRASI